MANRLTAQQEAEAVLKVWKDTMSVGEKWAVLDSKWWRGWLKYTGVNTDRKQIGEATGSRPGSLDNSRLQESKDKSDSLRNGIQENEDFSLIPSEVWDLVATWYGGGPAYIRDVVEIGIARKATLDLFPFVFQVVEAEQKSGSPDLANPKSYHMKRGGSLEDFRNSLLGKNDEKKEGENGPDRDSPIRFWLEEPKKEETKETVEGVSTAIADVTMTDATNTSNNNNSNSGAAAAAVAKQNGTATAAAAADGIHGAPGGAAVSSDVKPMDIASASSAANAATPPKSTLLKDGWKLVEDPKMGAPMEALDWLKDQTPRLLVERKKADGEWPRKAFIKDWRDFQVGDILDARDTVNKWYESTIKDVKDGKVLIHFNGWASTWDAWMPFDADSLAARNTYTSGPRQMMSSSSMSSWDYGGYGSNEEGRPPMSGCVGLRNLGNTCFMNSTLQCMSNTPLLTDYFVEERYANQINRNNPLGWQGRIADEYGALLKEVWSNKYRVVAPKKFKQVLGEFAPRFSGYQQQDSSELLSFLLDGLHEDLNQVKVKPATAAVESNDRADEVVAKEAWDTYLKRNRSVIVEWLQGQLKSKLVCPKCGKISITFDPFMFLSVPLPTVEDKVQEVHWVSADPTQPIRLLGPTVSKVGRISELKASLEKLVNVPAKRMVVADVWNNKIYRFIEDDAGVSELRSNDLIFVYEVPSLDEHKAGECVPIQIIHQRMERNPHYDPNYPHAREFQPMVFGIPRVIALPRKSPVTTHQIRQQITDTVARCVRTDFAGPAYKIVQTDADGRSCLKCSYTSNCTGCELEDNEAVFSFTDSQYSRDSRAGFCIQWQQDGAAFDPRADQLVKDKSLEGAVAQKQDSIDLFDCIKAFTKEEILSEQDPWYCNKCKDFRQASKKFDIWMLPSILIIHLKRFSYTRLWRDKISTYVDFPLDGLDMSPYVVSKEQKENAIYDCYAVSNHMGGMGGGHYTAYCKNLSDHKWYCHDDSRVSPATESEIKSDSAYVLFYKRRQGKSTTTTASASASSATSAKTESSSSSKENGVVKMSDN